MVTLSALQIQDFVLPDGSRVWLNKGAVLRYPESIHDGDRSLELEGEAFFEVQRDTLRPFTVRTHELVTRVLGTSFNINASLETRDVKVSVRSGKVQVAGKGFDDVLARGRELRYESGSGRVSVGDVAVADIAGWKPAQHFHFRNQTLAEVVSALEIYYEVTVGYPARLKDCPVVHADFRSDESIEKILTMLMIPRDGSVVRDSPERYSLRGEQCQ